MGRTVDEETPAIGAQSAPNINGGVSGNLVRVTFEVDPNDLFDTLRQIGDFGPLGERLVGALLVEKPGMAEAIGMAFYGVTRTAYEKFARPVRSEATITEVGQGNGTTP